MIKNDTILANGDCVTSHNKVNGLNPSNADFWLCELCDGVTPFEVCETHDEVVCSFCHLADILHGFHD